MRRQRRGGVAEAQLPALAAIGLGAPDRGHLQRQAFAIALDFDHARSAALAQHVHQRRDLVEAAFTGAASTAVILSPSASTPHAGALGDPANHRGHEFVARGQADRLQRARFVEAGRQPVQRQAARLFVAIAARDQHLHRLPSSAATLNAIQRLAPGRGVAAVDRADAIRQPAGGRRAAMPSALPDHRRRSRRPITSIAHSGPRPAAGWPAGRRPRSRCASTRSGG